MGDIYITKTFLPPLDEYQSFLEQIWKTRQVTNNGPFSQQLENELAKYLDVPHLKWLSNGTTGLQIAIQALNLKGNILTTPFTYIATANSIIWENCRPVFVDIDPETLSLDTGLLEENLDDQTVGVLAVHVYGYPCDVDGLYAFCNKYDLPLIFDAAHAFGVRYRGRSLTDYGDLSVLSFHATKVFHTIEGGAISTKDAAIAEKVDLYRAFGHAYDDYQQVGINAKNTELHAGIGLLNLKYFESLKSQRKLCFDQYHDMLKDTSLRLLHPSDYHDLEYNYGYMVSVFENERSLIRCMEALKSKRIYARRYFKPALNTLDYLNRSSCPNAEDLAGRVLCLPLYHDLAARDIAQICEIVSSNC